MLKLPALPQLKPRERLLAAGSGILLVVVLLDRVVLGPWAHHAQTVRQEIHRMETGLQQHRRLLARRERVFAELARYQRYLQPAVADELQMAALLKEIQQVAGDSHVTIAEIKPIGTEADEYAKRYTLEVRFACSLEEWVDFVYQIQSSPSLYAVARAGLSTKGETPDRLEGYLRVVSTAVRTAVAAPQAEAGGTRVASLQ